jgi:hypothetical protein
MTWAALSAQRQLAEKMELSHATSSAAPRSGKPRWPKDGGALCVRRQECPALGACLAVERALPASTPNHSGGAGREAVFGRRSRALCEMPTSAQRVPDRSIFGARAGAEFQRTEREAQGAGEGPPYARFCCLPKTNWLLPTLRSRCETSVLLPSARARRRRAAAGRGRPPDPAA